MQRCFLFNARVQKALSIFGLTAHAIYDVLDIWQTHLDQRIEIHIVKINVLFNRCQQAGGGRWGWNPESLELQRFLSA